MAKKNDIRLLRLVKTKECCGEEGDGHKYVNNSRGRAVSGIPGRW
jgi:hypothetical protein